MAVELPPNATGSGIETYVPATNVINITGIGPGPANAERQGVMINDGGRPTYSAAYLAQNAGTSATTDIFNLIGNAANTVRCVQIIFNMTIATAGQEFDLVIQKESALPTGGTKATAATIAPWDSRDSAAQATTSFYTVTPSAGTSVGTLFATKWTAFIATATTVTNQVLPLVVNFGVLPGSKVPRLAGAAQAIALTLNAATPGNANSIDISCVWTESVGD